MKCLNLDGCGELGGTAIVTFPEWCRFQCALGVNVSFRDLSFDGAPVDHIDTVQVLVLVCLFVLETLDGWSHVVIGFTDLLFKI